MRFVNNEKRYSFFSHLESHLRFLKWTQRINEEIEEAKVSIGVQLDCLNWFGHESSYLEIANRNNTFSDFSGYLCFSLNSCLKRLILCVYIQLHDLVSTLFLLKFIYNNSFNTAKEYFFIILKCTEILKCQMNSCAPLRWQWWRTRWWLQAEGHTKEGTFFRVLQEEWLSIR